MDTTTELGRLVEEAAARDVNAFAQLVERFQDMAVGYAFSLLGDFHAAEDAAQEAFLGAYLELPRLRDPEAFPGWFRRLVFSHCHRSSRRARPSSLPPEAADRLGAVNPDPQQALEAAERELLVHTALRALPDLQREVATLYYMGGLSQARIGAFLEIPEKTVKSRLHTARQRLRERMLTMVEESLEGQRPSRNDVFAGQVVAALTRLSDEQLGWLQAEVGRRDFRGFSAALSAADAEERERILARLPAAQVDRIEYQLLRLPPASQERQAAMRQVLESASQVPASPAAAPATRTASAAVQALVDDLRRHPYEARDLPARRRAIDAMVDLVGQEGILALGPVVEVLAGDGEPRFEIDAQLLVEGLRLAVDGVRQPVLDQMLQTRAGTLQHHLETRWRLLAEGLAGLCRTGYVPELLGHALRNHFALDLDPGDAVPTLKQKAGIERFSQLETAAQLAQALADYWRERLHRIPFARMRLADLTELFVDLAQMRGLHDVSVLADLLDAIDDAALRRGLRQVVDGVDGDEVRAAVDAEARAHLTLVGQRYDLARAGVARVREAFDSRG